MTTDMVTVPASLPLRELVLDYFVGVGARKHGGYPVLGRNGQFLGVITQANLLDHWLAGPGSAAGGIDTLGTSPIIAYDLIDSTPAPVHPNESCRETAERLAGSGTRRLPVVSLQDPTRLVGIVAIVDLLKARQRMIDEEATRERYFNRRELVGEEKSS